MNSRVAFLRVPFLCALALASAPVFATHYTLDPDHTQVVFSWNHFGFSNPTAQFGKVEGALDFDPAKPTTASVEVTIPLASLNTNVPALDEHLQKADFFDAAKFPLATFKSTRVSKGATAQQLKVVGNLTLHGVTKPVTLQVTINKVGTHPMRKAQAAGFDATTTIKRSEFGISQYVPMVGDDIHIRITVEAIESNAYSGQLKEKAKS